MNNSTLWSWISSQIQNLILLFYTCIMYTWTCERGKRQHTPASFNFLVQKISNSVAEYRQNTDWQIKIAWWEINNGAGKRRPRSDRQEAGQTARACLRWHCLDCGFPWYGATGEGPDCGAPDPVVFSSSCTESHPKGSGLSKRLHSPVSHSGNFYSQKQEGVGRKSHLADGWINY